MAAGRHRFMLVAGLVLLAIAAAFAAVTRADRAHPPTAGMDHAWLSLVVSTRNAPLTDLLKVLSLIGGPDGATVMVVAACIMLAVIRRWRTALYIALAEASGSASSQLVKHIVMRQRPPHPLVSADFGSFPSGHVITALAVGMALTVAFARPGRRRYPLAGAAAATAVMMFCRTYLAAHWLGDTLESLPIAMGLGLILWWTFDAALTGERGKPLRREQRRGRGEPERRGRGRGVAGGPERRAAELRSGQRPIAPLALSPSVASGVARVARKVTAHPYDDGDGPQAKMTVSRSSCSVVSGRPQHLGHQRAGQHGPALDGLPAGACPFGAVDHQRGEQAGPGRAALGARPTPGTGRPSSR